MYDDLDEDDLDDSETERDEGYTCPECAGKGYIIDCPISLADETPEAHEDCPVCGGVYYGRFYYYSCEGTGFL